MLNGHVKKISYEIASKITEAFPEVNKIWLLTGEGSMLNGTTIIGDCNATANGNNATATVAMNEALLGQLDIKDKQISDASDQIKKATEQIDRLLTIIEKMQS